MRTVYACQFDIVPRADESPAVCFERARDAIAGWVRDRLRTKWAAVLGDVEFSSDRPTVSHPTGGHIVTTSGVGADDSAVAQLEWSHPHDEEGTFWSTLCVVARVADRLQCAIQVRVGSTAFVIKPLSFSVAPPKLLDDLVAGFDCRFDGRSLTRTATRVGANGVGSLVTDVLLSATRRTPTIVVSVEPFTERPLVDPDALQRRLTGYAFVFLIDKWGSFRLTHALGRSLACFNGSVRLYWPGLAASENHPLFYGERIGDGFEEFLFRLLGGLATFRFQDGDVIREVQERLERRRAAEVGRLKAELLAGALSSEDWQKELERAWDEETRLRVLSDEKDRQVRELTEELEHQRKLWAENRAWLDGAAAEPLEITSPPAREFASVEEAFQEARRRFGGHGKALVFLERVADSARASPYKQADRVFELLEALSQIAEDWRANGRLGPGGWKGALGDRGFEYKPAISPTTRTKYGADYSFVYNGQKQVFEGHVTLGAGDPNTCASVHWILDETTKTLVIGHCGRHLPNTRT